MCDIVMAIKPRHIRNMEKGIKKYELRKTKPAKRGNYTVWICESGSGGKIVARFDCHVWPEMTNTDDKVIASVCAITPAEVRGYKQDGRPRLYGWLVQSFKYFETSEVLHITDFGLKRPPQSWCYAKEAKLNV